MLKKKRLKYTYYAVSMVAQYDFFGLPRSINRGRKIIYQIHISITRRHSRIIPGDEALPES